MSHARSLMAEARAGKKQEAAVNLAGNDPPIVSEPAIEALIVNWNSGDDLPRVLLGLHTQRDVALVRILVVDNDSTDGSLQRAQDAAPPFEFVQATANLGYTGGNNLGFRHLDMTTFVLICNPDVQFIDPHTLWHLASALNADPGLAAVAPLIIRDDGEPTYTEALLDLRLALVGLKPRRHTIMMPALLSQKWLDGAILLIRSPVLLSAGGFDDRYFLFDDEVDLSIRLRESGWRLGLVTDARVTHRGNASFGTSRKGSYYFWRNLYLLCRVHAPGVLVWRAAWAARFLKNLLDPSEMRARRSGPMLRGALDALRGRFGPGPEDR